MSYKDDFWDISKLVPRKNIKDLKKYLKANEIEMRV